MYIDELLQDHKDLLDTLPVPITNTLLWYSDEGYQDLNKNLRYGSPLTDEQYTHLQNLDYIFSKLVPINHSITVYKGIDILHIESDKAYVSTTYHEKQTHEFTGDGCCVIVFTVVPGSRVLSMEKYSVHGHEKEILLNKNGKFEITGIEDVKPYKKIHVTYLPTSALQVETLSEIQTQVFDQIKTKELIERIVNIFNKDELELLDEEDIRKDVAMYYKKFTGENISSGMMDDVMKAMYS